MDLSDIDNAAQEDWLEAVYTEISVSLVDGSRPQPQLRQIGSPWRKGMKGNPPQ